MRSNFNKVFNNPLPQPEQKIPDSYAKYISKFLPKGFRYVPFGDGACVIVSDTDKFTISGLQFDPTEEQKNDLGENYSFDDVLSYIENSQQPMKLTPPESGLIKINGNDFEYNKIITFPFLNIDTSQSYYMMQAPKFPPPFPITLGGEVYEYTLNLSRVANNSINIHVYESEQTENPIWVQICKNIKNSDIQFNMNCNPQAAKTVKDLATCLAIYNDFIDGKGKINSNNLPTKKTGIKKFDLKLVNFWVKVMKIAEVLEVDFVPTEENISQFTAYNVERVYQNLINRIPVRSLGNVDSLEENKNDDGAFCISEMVGKCIGLVYEKIEHFDFFGNSFELPELVGICNAEIESVIPKNSGGNTVTLKDKSLDEKRYVSILAFRNLAELEEFRQNNFDKMMNILSNAKSVTDLI